MFFLTHLVCHDVSVNGALMLIEIAYEGEWMCKILENGECGF